ncbi:MAG: lysylphosphatidylglycerol synthase domain-containing protein [Tenuifilaceae bacterium]|nr:lysylphosphatidylglycerol synthase domain-containing protein [Tenuifilaceae bacterium]
MKTVVVKYLRAIIGVAVYFIVAYKIFGADKHFSFSELLERSHWGLLLLVTLLMPISWFFEALKWKVVVAEVQPLSIMDSWKSVWYGVAAGQLTPNRVGEPVGRAALLLPQHRARGVYAAAWCALSQQLATVSFGVVGVVVWLYAGLMLPGNMFVSNIAISLLVIFWVASVLLVVIAPNALFRLIVKIPYAKKWVGSSPQIFAHSKKVIAISVGLSLVRYFVFSTQFLLMLMALDVVAPLHLLYAAIWLTYLFSSAIPTFAWSEAGVRAGFSILFVGMITPNTAVVALAAMLLWIVNVGFPALVGAWVPWGRGGSGRSEGI